MKFLLLLPFLLAISTASWKPKEIKDLPGAPKNLEFKQYAGYLDSSGGKGIYKSFFWFAECRNNPATAPVVMWLNGGPGASSLLGMFTIHGPLHPNDDGGQTLFDNVLSWNQVANFIYLETPLGVGFSYALDNRTAWSDNSTAEVNYQALKDFFGNVFPQYQKNDFYIAGESYGGTYIPTLANRILDGLIAGDFTNKNFKGMAVGNGCVDNKIEHNSKQAYFYYHGLYGNDEWEIMKKRCCDATCPDECDFHACQGEYYENATPREKAVAAQAIKAFMHTSVPRPKKKNGDMWNDDRYNIYQSCYSTETVALLNYKYPWFYKNSILINSTDPFGGFPCWNEDNMKFYLNRRDVWEAIGLDKEWMKRKGYWNVYEIQYTKQFSSMLEVFDAIIEKSQPGFKVLMYNGDLDTACNFLQTSWFIDKVAKKNHIPAAGVRYMWYYRDQIAGYIQRFKKDIQIDVLTAKGAGHMVPTDRPGPALQMLASFILDRDYSQKFLL